MGRQARYRESDKKLESEATGELEKVCLKFKNFSLSLSNLKLKLAIETDLNMKSILKIENVLLLIIIVVKLLLPLQKNYL